jgi:hypothetical protein
MRFVAAAWHRAQDMMVGIASESGQAASASVPASAQDANAVTQCLEALRMAAGAANCLAETVLPQVANTLGDKSLPECAPMTFAQRVQHATLAARTCTPRLSVVAA